MADQVQSPNAGLAVADDGGGAGDPASGGGGGSSSAGSGRKPRGRPRGSKNKPKPPVVITRESESAMQPVVLELAAGCDVIESLSVFALRRRVGVSVLSASGSVANVTLRYPASPTSAVTLRGRFDILSLAGTLVPPSSASAAKAPFTICLAGTQGQVIGGIIAGTLTAAGPVVIVAATFMSTEVFRLPVVEEEEAVAEEEEEDVEDVKPAAEAMSVYSPLTGQLSPHEMVLWGPPSSRTPAPHLAPRY